MNESQSSKTAVIKTLAIIGFFATIALVVWLLIQGMRVMPDTFSSLANIAETVQNYRPATELTVATEKSVVNSGESFRLTWTDMKKNGEYRFTYICTDGVSLDVRGESDMVTIPCTESLTLPRDVHGLFVSVTSERQRFTDVPFTVAFINANGETIIERNAQITVVNATIPTKTEVASTATTTRSESTKPETTPPAKPVATTAPKPTTSSQVAAPVASAPQVKETVVTYIPQSDPNGFTDLRVSYLGIGTQNGSVFTPTGVYDNDTRGAFKFEVKNIGTKTSATWTFTATLPTGVTYTGDTQPALKPNERVEFTLGFNMGNDTDAGTEHISVEVHEKNDTNEKNDSFDWSVKIVD